MTYIQTWQYIPFNRPVRRAIRWLCLALTGHVASRTEYEVSRALDGTPQGCSYCRWCGVRLLVTDHPAKRRVDFMVMCEPDQE